MELILLHVLEPCYICLLCSGEVCHVNKMSRGSSHGSLVHLLRYLRDNMYLGLKFYSDITMSPITRLLSSDGISLDNPLCTFTDSSWNDDIDTGRSSGCFKIFYMGGVVEHSSNLPHPVALSNAEAEYNEACSACMATAHLKQFLTDLELPFADDKKSKKPIQIFIDNRSAVDGCKFQGYTENMTYDEEI
jgi:hypothetical protein